MAKPDVENQTSEEKQEPTLADQIQDLEAQMDQLTMHELVFGTVNRTLEKVKEAMNSVDGTSASAFLASIVGILKAVVTAAAETAVNVGKTSQEIDTMQEQATELRQQLVKEQNENRISTKEYETLSNVVKNTDQAIEEFNSSIEKDTPNKNRQQRQGKRSEGVEKATGSQPANASKNLERNASVKPDSSPVPPRKGTGVEIGP